MPTAAPAARSARTGACARQRRARRWHARDGGRPRLQAQHLVVAQACAQLLQQPHRPACSLWRVGNSSALGALRCTSSWQCSCSSSVGAASCTRPGVRAAAAAGATSTAGSASSMRSSVTGGVRRVGTVAASWCMCSVKATMRDCRACAQATSWRQQQRGAVQHLVGMVGPKGQFQPARKRSGACSHTRGSGGAAGAVQFVEQIFAEAPRQPGTRQVAQVGQVAQAHALQRLPVFTPRAQQPHRGFVQQLLQRRQVRGGAGRRPGRRASAPAAQRPARWALRRCCTRWPSGFNA
jgi:hypothetical protein